MSSLDSLHYMQGRISHRIGILLSFLTVHEIAEILGTSSWRDFIILSDAYTCSYICCVESLS